jgi:iodotyrosine deiodinase
MNSSPFVPAPRRPTPSDEELLERAKTFYVTMHQRRTVRDFSDRPVRRQVIENCIRAAGTAPNGANLQPWHFVAISDPKLKREIRLAAEIEEREFYQKPRTQGMVGSTRAIRHRLK